MDREPDGGDVTALFDRWARDGVADEAADRHRRTAGRVLAELDLGPGDRFVDLGTGNGWACRTAARQGATAVGVDLSPEMLSRARSLGPGVYVRATFDRLPFPDAEVDVVFSMEAIYYADDLDRALAEVRRVLAPDGAHHAVIDYYEENEASEDWPTECGVPMHRLSEAQWRDAFSKAGFVDVGSGRIRADGAEDWRGDVGSLHVHGRAPDPRT